MRARTIAAALPSGERMLPAVLRALPLLVVIACGAPPPPPVAPPAPAPLPQESRPLAQAAPAEIAAPAASARACTGDCCWKLELLAPEPPIEIGQVRVRPGGAWRVVTIAGGVPNSPAPRFDRAITEAWATTDTDGTIVFTGHWIGN